MDRGFHLTSEDEIEIEICVLLKNEIKRGISFSLDVEELTAEGKSESNFGESVKSHNIHFHSWI